MTDPYFPWSPIVSRPTLSWPEGARIAFGVVLSLERMVPYAEPGTIVAEGVRGRTYPAIPDIHLTSQFEYGNRVGVFRLLDVLAANGITPMVAMDTALATATPRLVEHLVDHGSEFVGHGPSGAAVITEEMSEAAETSVIEASVQGLAASVGSPIRGWLGVDYGESSRTVRLLADQGIDYVLDWPLDEQPVRAAIPQRTLVSLPVMIELDDVVTHIGRGGLVAERRRALSIAQYVRMIEEQFDRLYRDAESTGRVFILHLHPWISGQPFRVRHLAATIAKISSTDGVWCATGGQITDWFVDQTEASGEGVLS